MIEAGVPDYVVTAFFGVAAPAGTPAPVIAKLDSVINDGLRTEALRAGDATSSAPRPRSKRRRNFPPSSPPSLQKWKGISDASGIKVD